MKAFLTGLAVLASGLATAEAQEPTLKPALAGVSFLIGDWRDGAGQVAETGGRSAGESHVSVAANGGALLRRDHTLLFGADGKPAGAFDQVMMIYPEGGALRADYTDGEHVIHYLSARITPGSAVTFSSAPDPKAPTFQLAYRLVGQDTLSVNFSMAPPGSDDFRSIASGTLRRGG